MKKIFLVLIVLIFTVSIIYLNRLVTSPVLSENYESGILPVSTPNAGETMQITLESTVTDSNIKVMANGNVIADFEEPEVVLNLTDNSLIEIDGTNEKKQFDVLIKGVSSNADQYFGNSKITVQGNIVILDRFLLQ